jgi:broad specificity phosphatase PhoE
MLNIYVARHGQDLDNANDILNGHRDQPLTELGRQQARDVGNRMLQEGFRLSSSSHSIVSSGMSTTLINAIYSSPLQRAHETAKIFGSILSSDVENNSCNNLQVKIIDDLIERDFGILTGMPTSSILEKCGDAHVLTAEMIHYFLDPEGAETFPDLIDRAKKLLSYIGQEMSNNGAAESYPQSILLVTHGDFGKMLYAAYYDLDWKEVLKQFHFGNSEVLLLSKDSPPENAHVFETSQFNP